MTLQTPRIAPALPLVWLFVIGLAAPASTQGIRPLDSAGHAKAVEAGQTRRAEDIAGDQMPIVISALKDGKESYLTSAPFNIVIETPYGRVATAVARNRRTGGRAEPPTMAAANAAGVVLKIGPGSAFQNVQKIQSVFVKRGADVVRPTKSSIIPTVVRSNGGSSKDASEGEFSFAFNAFDGSTPVTIVVVGEAGNFEWTMTPGDLQAIR